MADSAHAVALLPLDHLAVVEFAGADAAAFLQGQLSSDVLSLAAGESQLASYNTPKGRVVAVVRLMRDSDRLLGILPAELAGLVVERLRKYVLRSRVTLRVAPELAVLGTIEAPHRLTVRAASPSPQSAASAAPVAHWKRAGIAAGLPQVYAATSELFVAQMLNLDLVGGISFHKGCYTGQEIIARTQNLGRIKRRMLRFAARSGAAIAPGNTVTLGGFGTGTVVDVARVDADALELLAVVHLEPQSAEATRAAAIALEARELPLPYAIPEWTATIRGR